MLPRIKELITLEDYKLKISFDDGKTVIYDVMDDINEIPSYRALKDEIGFFQLAKIDTSRTIVYWDDNIDLPSDAIYEYGKEI